MEANEVWYLSHHEVFHKRKRKLRVVFNCSLKFDGISLNDCLRKGPDLTNNLLDVLMKFRTGKIAVIGDIRQMFYQVRVPKCDSNLMRFFWINSDGDIKEYRLLVHVFGATSSPSVANFALKSTAEISECSSEVASIITSNFYVDDMLASFPSTELALAETSEVKRILAKRKFELTSFSSNCPEVSNKLDPENSTEVEVPQLVTEESSALGIKWNIKKDVLYFCARLHFEPPTKRNVLKFLASIYDPIGIVSPAIVPAKKIFQMTCRSKLSWDDELPPHLLTAWKNWKKKMLKLSEYEIPRCSELSMQPTLIELHVFAMVLKPHMVRWHT